MVMGMEKVMVTRMSMGIVQRLSMVPRMVMGMERVMVTGMVMGTEKVMGMGMDTVLQIAQMQIALCMVVLKKP